MECFEKPDDKIRQKILKNWDQVAKPIDGMGQFEPWIAQIGAILGSETMDFDKKAVLIFCADNGIVEEGVSQSGPEVTAAVARSMGKGASSVGKMAQHIGAETVVIDLGIRDDAGIEGVWDRKIRRGTRNFRKEPAMTETEVLQAIAVGMEVVAHYKNKGYQLLALGEMGIGNTTTSSAVAAALLGCPATEVTGRGAGLSDQRLFHKQEIIQEAITAYDLYHADAFTVLKTVGGLDLAGLVGACIGGAAFHIPIVLDGVISMVAALTAERLCPGTKEYLIPSHRGKEPAVLRIAKELGLAPVLDAGLALGEGTGAVMMLSLLELALCVYENRTTFSDIQVEQYERL